TPFDPFSFGTPEEVDEETRADAARAARAAALAAGAAPAPGPAESALRFGNLGVVMEFTLAERKPVFSLVTETLSFDLANSRARPGALYAGFPLRLTGFLATPDPRLADAALPESAQSAQDPSTQGYVSAGGPIQQSRLIDPWYGLVYEVDLGTLGALAGSAGLALRLLVAWSGGGTGDAPAVYVGVRLPGVKDALGVELPLQGVMSLGFRTIEFVVAEGTGPREYMLRFRNFALRFLGISFPPGYNDILLFGNPDATSRTKLGWYAAYSAEKDEKRQQQPSPQARMFAARRGPAPLALAAGGEGDGGGAGVPAAEPRTTGGSA
ncbi:MAG TPA: hypothetical protein VHG08_18130, partial [Longimicrobium sp.]|nr:hypothetical protein [Longimicrobium sp.]